MIEFEKPVDDYGLIQPVVTESSDKPLTTALLN
jgi:hypothetical protein